MDEAVDLHDAGTFIRTLVLEVLMPAAPQYRIADRIDYLPFDLTTGLLMVLEARLAAPGYRLCLYGTRVSQWKTRHTIAAHPTDSPRPPRVSGCEHVLRVVAGPWWTEAGKTMRAKLNRELVKVIGYAAKLPDRGQAQETSTLVGLALQHQMSVIRELALESAAGLRV